MAKDPTFPFYAQDFLVDTIRWDRAMQGLHVCLLAESWANGGLKDDGGKPAGLGSTDVDLWLKIKHKWILETGEWKSAKLEEVRADRKAFRAKQSEKGKLSAEKRKTVKPQYQPDAQPKTNSGSTAVEPLEGESEKEVLKEQLKGALDEIFIEAIRGQWRHVDFGGELQSFRTKVLFSPRVYRDHGVPGLRLALQAQLRSAKPKPGSQSSKAQETLNNIANA